MFSGRWVYADLGQWFGQGVIANGVRWHSVAFMGQVQMPRPRKQFDPYESMAVYFGSRIRALRDTYEVRVGESLNLGDLSAKAGYARSMLTAIERGEVLPDRRTRVQALDDALEAKGELVAVWPLVQRLGRIPITDLVLSTTAAEGYRGSTTQAAHQEEEDVERRLLLKLTSLGLLSQAVVDEPARQMLERVLNRSADVAETYTVQDWEMACADHMHALQTQPPAVVRSGITGDVIALQQALAAPGVRAPADLQRVASQMAIIQANVLTRLGEYDAARRWWITARHAADASGDLNMRVWAMGYEAVFALYSPRSPHTTVALAQKARALAGKTPDTGLRHAVAAEAQGLAVLGRDKEALEALHYLHDICERVPSTKGFAWGPDSIWFVTSWVHSFVGSDRTADEACDKALAAERNSSRYQNRVNVQLHRSIRASRVGDYERGLRGATEMIDGLPAQYRSLMILNTAHRVIDAVPIEKRAQLKGFGDYQAAIKPPAFGAA
ncbi:multiprotein-bridging factor 1 family protein [Spongiactinospora sp. 9N601]|uniref:multiprotein-bridging factor 1 family protein n=1 Tax=Spongiactinospora sp. 9N601 TaxID=3375149 RepID=UPI0037BB89B9